MIISSWYLCDKKKTWEIFVHPFVISSPKKSVNMNICMLKSILAADKEKTYFARTTQVPFYYVRVKVVEVQKE